MMAEFGGSAKFGPVTIKAEEEPWDWKDYSLVFDVPAYGVAAFEFDYVEPPKKRVRAGTKVVSSIKSAALKPANKKTDNKKADDRKSVKVEK